MDDDLCGRIGLSRAKSAKLGGVESSLTGFTGLTGLEPVVKPSTYTEKWEIMIPCFPCIQWFCNYLGLDNHVNLVNPVEKDSPPLHS